MAHMKLVAKHSAEFTSSSKSKSSINFYIHRQIFAFYSCCLILLIKSHHSRLHVFKRRIQIIMTGDYIYVHNNISPSNFTIYNKMAIDLMAHTVTTWVLFHVFLSQKEVCMHANLQDMHTQIKWKWYYPMICHSLSPIQRLDFIWSLKTVLVFVG